MAKPAITNPPMSEGEFQHHMEQWRYVRNEWEKVLKEFYKSMSDQQLDAMDKLIEERERFHENTDPGDMPYEEYKRRLDEYGKHYTQRAREILGETQFTRLVKMRDQFNEDMRGETTDVIEIGDDW